MKRFAVSFGAVAILLGLAPLSIAQQDRPGQQDRPRVQQDRPGQAGQQRGQQRGTAEAGQIDEKLAAWLACGNRMEVELGQLATQKATDPQVRQFAQKMVEEHSQLIQQLREINPQIEPVAAGRTTERPGQLGQRGERGERTQRTPQTPGASDDPLMQIGKQASERMVELTKTYLQDKQGPEFDKCYIGQQIAAHIAMSAQLDAMQEARAGSPQFQQIVSKASQATQGHLQQATQIAQTLEGGEGAAARLSRRPGQPQPLEQPQQPERDR